MKPPAFQFYADDFVAGTVEMTTPEIGAYILLLCYQWSKGFIPDDDNLIRRIARETQAFDLATLRTKFKSKNGKLFNVRLEQERQKEIEFRKKQSDNGQKGGRPRNPSLSQALSKPKAKKSSPSPSPSPVLNPQHQAFIDGWCQNFETKFALKYKFDGGRDGVAVKNILRLGIMAIDLLEIAKKSWDNPNILRYRSAATISGFVNNFNQIQAELKNGNEINKSNSPQRVDRSVGTSNEGTAAQYRGLGRVAKNGDAERS